MSGAVVGSEDCLTVNVWSPPNAKGLPVMVFLHVGRHVVGYAHMPILLGTARDEQAYFRPDVPGAERYAALMREEFPKVAEQALALYPVSKYGTPKAAYIARNMSVWSSRR
jgi:carboxylesterase type B